MNTVIILSAKYLIFVIAAIALFVLIRLDKTQRLRFCLWAVTAGVVALILTKAAGVLYFDPRPFALNHTIPLITHEPDNGFPSDHTVVSMLAALLVLPFQKKLGLALAVLACGVGAARVAAQVHSPLDIGASIAVAALAWLAGRGAVSIFEARKTAQAT